MSETLEDLGFISPFLARMIRIGEESGNLDVVLEKAAVCYERELAAAR